MLREDVVEPLFLRIRQIDRLRQFGVAPPVVSQFGKTWHSFGHWPHADPVVRRYALAGVGGSRTRLVLRRRYSCREQNQKNDVRRSLHCCVVLMREVWECVLPVSMPPISLTSRPAGCSASGNS